MLGQLTGEQETDSGLDLSGGDGSPLVVVGKAGSLAGDALEQVVDEAVHDAHGLGRDASVGVDLFQHLVDVDAVAFPPLPAAFLAPSSGFGCLLDGLLGPFGSDFGWHDFCQTTATLNKRKILCQQKKSVFITCVCKLGDRETNFEAPNILIGLQDT